MVTAMAGEWPHLADLIRLNCSMGRQDLINICVFEQFQDISGLLLGVICKCEGLNYINSRGGHDLSCGTLKS